MINKIYFNLRTDIIDWDYDINFFPYVKNGKWYADEYEIIEGGPMLDLPDSVIENVEEDINFLFPQAAFIRTLADFLEKENVTLHSGGVSGISAKIGNGRYFLLNPRNESLDCDDLRKHADRIEAGET